jgi:putative membrane protein insertion efficiency factor
VRVPISSLIRLPQATLTFLVKGYRLLLKPWIGNVCRFEPSCSEYALQALQTHGALRGAVLSGGRILRCHPWCEGGADPVHSTFSMPGSGLFTRLLARREPEPAETRSLTRKIP